MSTMQRLIQALTKKIQSGQMSVADVAKAVGCSRQYVYDLMDSDQSRQLTVPLAEKIAAVCGYRLEFVQSESKKTRRKATA